MATSTAWLQQVVTIEVDKESKLLPIFVPMPKKDSVSAFAALKEALTLCQNRNLHLQADGGGQFNNQKLKDLCFDRTWIDHEGRVYQGIPYAVEPDATASTVFIASMMHARVQHPVLSEKPDVTCPSDVQDNERRKEAVHHEEVPGHPKSKKRNSQSPVTKSRPSSSKPRAFLRRRRQWLHRLGP